MLTLSGWAVGIPLGWLIYEGLLTGPLRRANRIQPGTALRYQ